jgi:hypothetical protein
VSLASWFKEIKNSVFPKIFLKDATFSTFGRLT